MLFNLFTFTFSSNILLTFFYNFILSFVHFLYLLLALFLSSVLPAFISPLDTSLGSNLNCLLCCALLCSQQTLAWTSFVQQNSFILLLLPISLPSPYVFSLLENLFPLCWLCVSYFFLFWESKNEKGKRSEVDDVSVRHFRSILLLGEWRQTQWGRKESEK